jgi:hypothetical protein
MNNDNDDVPLLEEPIVAKVRMTAGADEKPMSLCWSPESSTAIETNTSRTRFLTGGVAAEFDSSTTEEAIRRLTQFIIGSTSIVNTGSVDTKNAKQHQDRSTTTVEAPNNGDETRAPVLASAAESEQKDVYVANTIPGDNCGLSCISLAEQLPESFLPLYNAITMLQSHARLAHQEASMAVLDADTACRQAQLWQHRAVTLAQERSILQDDNVQLKRQTTVLSQQRTTLKRAYKRLLHQQASEAERNVETALLLHEDHLRGIICHNSCTENTSDTEVSFDEEEEVSSFKEDFLVKNNNSNNDEQRTAALSSSPVQLSSSPSSSLPSEKMQLSSSPPPSPDSNSNNSNNQYYKPLQLQVTSGSMQKQLLQKHRLPRAKIIVHNNDLTSPLSPTSVLLLRGGGGGVGGNDNAVPSSIVYQS